MSANQNSGIQMSTHILAKKYAFSKNLIPIYMTSKDFFLAIKALILCKYLNVDDFIRMLYTQENS